MNRQFEIGDRVVCKESGVIGKILRFYVPTACDEQTLVLTDDGRQYHAPTNAWVKTNEPTSVIITTGFDSRKISEQIDISYKETIERLNYFNRRDIYSNE